MSESPEVPFGKDKSGYWVRQRKKKTKHSTCMSEQACTGITSRISEGLYSFGQGAEDDVQASMILWNDGLPSRSVMAARANRDSLGSLPTIWGTVAHEG